MAIIEKINTFLKKGYNSFSFLDIKTLKIQKFNFFTLVFFFVILSCVFIISINLIKKKMNTTQIALKKSLKLMNFPI